jgi:hypothetical protein
MVRLRALVSAHDAAALWDLRCLVRECLVSYVWEHQPVALPRLRGDLDPPRPDAGQGGEREPAAGDHGRVFSGSTDGERRGARFVGPENPVGGERRR